MHRGDLGGVGVHHVDVERLALVDVSTTVGCHVEDVALLDFPGGLVEVSDVLRNAVNALNGTLMAEDIVFHFQTPHVFSDEVAHEVLVQHNELARKGAANIEVGGEGLKTLVVAKNLGGRSGWHGGEQERVAHALFHDFSLERIPVPATAVLVHAPEVKLQLTFAGR